MTKVIRVDDEVYAWLKAQAEPLKDGPKSVLRRIAEELMWELIALPEQVKEQELMRD